MKILYHYPLSPFCRKIRLMLSEKGLLFQLEDRFPSKLMEKAPLEEPPLLFDENNYIYDHYVIAEYIEEAYKSPNLFGETLTERAEIRRLSRWFDEKFFLEVSSHIINEKIKKRLAGEEPNSTNLYYAKKNLNDHLFYISHLLTKNAKLASKYLSLADISASAHLSVLDYLGEINWEKYPEVKEWYACMKSRPSFSPLLSDKVRGIFPSSHYKNPDF
ncbi:MAG: Dichloromethane dehalogenase [Alphaproteobacteria bacterium ADurb.Bin438]|nr:MAG: Dichloromethane dehalogenase [Alphaproteobacteria bacterium ADurb.Bin438]